MATAARDEEQSALAAMPATRNEAARSWHKLELAELWRYRELLYFLTWRDIKVRYRQTGIGAAWAVLQPVLTGVVFSFVFGHLAKVPSEGVPYPIFAFAALVPWTFFANAVTTGANSMVVTPDLVTKIYFPRVIMPAASVLGGGVDLGLSLLVLFGMMAYYGIFASLQVLVVLPLLLLMVVAAMGVALWLSAINVEYRDVRQALPFLIQIWLFATPIAYPSSLVGEPWRTLVGLNPMAGVVEGFRWALLDTSPSPGPMLLASAGVAVALLLTGILYFSRAEERFADVI